jgi:ethanolamine permease
LGALGISAVIPGEFSGWNYGLIEGGFGGLLIATLVVAVMYLCLCVSLAELSTAMPLAGGGYAYARTAMGHWAGYLTGVAQNVEFILTAAAVVVSIGEVAKAWFAEEFGLHLPAPLIWSVAYAVFTAINMFGVGLTCRVAVLLTAAALATLALFAVAVAPRFDLELALDVPVQGVGTVWLPHGLSGIAWAIPFAIWFLVDIEMVTLAAEETVEPARNLPKGLLYGIAVLIVAALVVLFVNSAIPPGALAIGTAQEPFIVGLRTNLGHHGNIGWIAMVVLVGYVAGFHAEVFAYGRSLFSLGRAGYLPNSLALTHPTRKTPYVALLAGGAFGLSVTSALQVSGAEQPIDAVLVNMAVYAAIVSYVMQMLAFLVLRRRLPAMGRPFSSPFGATGAMTALVISVAAGILMLFFPAYRWAMYGCLTIFGIAALYFWISGRHRIVATAPEEVFAEEQQRIYEARATPRPI